jgi:hypothetical protein
MKSLGKVESKWEEYIKLEPKETRREGADCSHVVQGRRTNSDGVLWTHSGSMKGGEFLN